MKSRTAPTVRCAIYTRKSTEEGLDQEFNSLDAQRESGEAYIASMKHEGWICRPDRYDDGGFTGGNMDRPALRRLMSDIEAGQIDCVVVYKVDRLSRSLLDFARMMETFEKHGISFVSVTQQFNTTHSMGRLTLNILLSFAQFEREIISERTRDKIAAARRRGKWSGGMPLLGYDIDPRGSKLVVNVNEAEQVREIFRLYLDHQALMPVVEELNRRGWRRKRWTTRKGKFRGGGPFTKASVYAVLTNITYLGKLRYKDEVHDGEHEAILHAEAFERTQAILHHNGRTGGAHVRNKYGALLRGLVHCAACRQSMTHRYSSKKGTRYRYYVCRRAQQEGWKACPAPSVPAPEIEQFVVEQIKDLGREPGLIRETLEHARKEIEETIRRLDAEREALQRQVRRDEAESRKLSLAVDPHAVDRLADLQVRVRNSERRMTEIHEELLGLRHELVDESEVATALARFDPVWECLAPREQARILALLIERIDYDGPNGRVSITFRPTGLSGLIERLAEGDAA
ncbi:MAG: recombinase family protein [Planctomycetaceae bacterium]